MGRHRTVTQRAPGEFVQIIECAAQIACIGQRATFQIERAGDVRPAPVDLTDQIGQWHAHVMEVHLIGSIARPGVQRADLDSRAVDRDDDYRNAPMPSTIGIGAYAEPLVGGPLGAAVPDFAAVDHPFLANAHRTGAQIGQVGSGLRLRIAYRADYFALGDRRQPFGFVLLGAVPHDHRRYRCDRQVGSGHAPVFKLVHQQVLVNGAEPQSPVFARPVQPEPAFLADLAAKPRYLPAGELQIMLGEFGS